MRFGAYLQIEATMLGGSPLKYPFAQTLTKICNIGEQKRQIHIYIFYLQTPTNK